MATLYTASFKNKYPHLPHLEDGGQAPAHADVELGAPRMVAARRCAAREVLGIVTIVCCATSVLGLLVSFPIASNISRDPGEKILLQVLAPTVPGTIAIVSGIAFCAVGRR